MAETYDLILKGGTVVNQDGEGAARSRHPRRPLCRHRRPVARLRRRGDRLPRPASAAGRDRQPRAFPRARPHPQGGPGNRLARRGAGRRHRGVRNAQHRADHHQRRGARRQGQARPSPHALRLRLLCRRHAREHPATSPNWNVLPGACGVKVFMGSSTGSLLVEDDDGVRAVLKSIRRRAAFHSEDEYRLRERMHLRVEGDPRSHPVWRDAHRGADVHAAPDRARARDRQARARAARHHQGRGRLPRRAQGRRHGGGDARASHARRARLLRAARHARPAQSADPRRRPPRRPLARRRAGRHRQRSAPTTPRTRARKRRILIRRPIPA